MTIKQMQYFAAVCETENLTKAAQKLFISQPTLSVSIRELEAEVGCTLFSRVGTHIITTDEGRALLTEIRGVLLQYDQMYRAVKSGILKKKYIRLGFSAFVGTAVASQICRRFEEDHPDTAIRISEDHGANLLQMLDDRRLDAVITGTRHSSSWINRFEMMSIGENKISYCVARNHRFAKKRLITLKEIAEEPIIMLDESFAVSNGIKNFFNRQGFELNIILRTTQIFTVERFIAAGGAGGFLPSIACEGNSQIKSLPCRELGEFQASAVSIYWKKENEYSPVLKDFLDSAKQQNPK